MTRIMINMDKPEYRRAKMIGEAINCVKKYLRHVQRNSGGLIEELKIFPGIRFEARSKNISDNLADARFKFFVNRDIATKDDLKIIDDLMYGYEFLAEEFGEQYKITHENSWGTYDVVFHDIPVHRWWLEK